MLVHQIGMIFMSSSIMVLIFMMLKQPFIPAYVLAGVLIGPIFLGSIHDPKAIIELSEMAVVIMLFVIGNEMDISRLSKVGLVAILGGIAQVAITFIAGFFLAKFVGLGNIPAVYLGFAASFSSTMLVVKTMGDKHDMETLYGRINIGILIMQDILAIFALSILLTIDNISVDIFLSTITLAAGLILIVVFVCGKFIFPKVFKYIARDGDVLINVVLGILFLISFYAENQKLSFGIGAFLAGISMSHSSYRFEFVSELNALKSFFLVIFFASLGLQIAPDAGFGAEQGFLERITSFASIISEHNMMIGTFFVLSVVVKPLIVMVLISMFGYDKGTAFNSGVSLGQFSEFSLVLIAQGIAAGHLSSGLLAPFIITTVLGMTASSYLMKYSLVLFEKMNGKLSWLRLLRVVKEKKFEFEENASNDFKVLLVGRDRLGSIIGKALKRKGVEYLVIDSNPDVGEKLVADGIPFIFGDINEHNVRAQINFGAVETVFSTLPDMRDNEALINYLREVNPKANFIAIANYKKDAERLYELGAHFVLVVHELAARQLLMSRGKEEISLDAIIEGGEGLRERGLEHSKFLFRDITEKCCPQATELRED